MGKLVSAKSKASRRHLAPRKQKADKTRASAFQEMVTFLKSPVGERLIVLEIFICTVTTLMIFLLYQRELRRREEIHMAVDMIRSIVVEIDPLYEDKDDALVENLDDGWVIYERTFYWFSVEIGTWTDAKEYCEQEGARLISVDTWEEQYFINKQAESYQKFFWIGIFKDKGIKWSWLSGVEAVVSYWNYGEPTYEANHDCGAVSFQCYNDRCWTALECDVRIHYICKKGPVDTWL